MAESAQTEDTLGFEKFSSGRKREVTISFPGPNTSCGASPAPDAKHLRCHIDLKDITFDDDNSESDDISEASNDMKWSYKPSHDSSSSKFF